MLGHAGAKALRVVVVGVLGVTAMQPEVINDGAPNEAATPRQEQDACHVLKVRLDGLREPREEQDCPKHKEHHAPFLPLKLLST